MQRMLVPRSCRLRSSECNCNDVLLNHRPLQNSISPVLSHGYSYRRVLFKWSDRCGLAKKSRCVLLVFSAFLDEEREISAKKPRYPLRVACRQSYWHETKNFGSKDRIFRGFWTWGDRKVSRHRDQEYFMNALWISLWDIWFFFLM